ncbi:MAG: hypothetical protein R2710_10745 [Acidimicrobiales bacterium]
MAARSADGGNGEDDRPVEGREPNGEDSERTVPVTLPPRPGGRANGSIVMAAMVGISEALGFDKQQEEVAEAAASSGQPLDLDFGDLPPLT